MNMDTEREAAKSFGSRLEDAGRRDYHMRTDAQTYEEGDLPKLIRELTAWREDHPDKRGKIPPWEHIANLVGIAPSTFSQAKDGVYRGDTQKICRALDEFLARQAEKRDRLDGREFVTISIARKMRGAAMTAITNNSMAAIIGDPGTGKTKFAIALGMSLTNSIFIRVIQGRGTAKHIIRQIYDEIRKRQRGQHNVRYSGEMIEVIEDYLLRHRNVVIIVDEAQKLAKSGLEVIRDFHDRSDMGGSDCIPVIFFGDREFLRHIQQARKGVSNIVAPQLSRRIAPVFDVENERGEDGGAPLYSTDDIVRVLKNDRLRIFTPAGIRWITKLANLKNYGALGFAVQVARIAYETTRRRPIDVDDLREALRGAIGPDADAVSVDGQDDAVETEGRATA